MISFSLKFLCFSIFQKAMPLLCILVLLPYLRILPILLSVLLMLGYKNDQLRIKLYLM